MSEWVNALRRRADCWHALGLQLRRCHRFGALAQADKLPIMGSGLANRVEDLRASNAVGERWNRHRRRGRLSIHRGTHRLAQACESTELDARESMTRIITRGRRRREYEIGGNRQIASSRGIRV